MPREGSQTLSDLRSQVLRIACDRCGRSGRYNAARLWRERGDLKLTDLGFAAVRPIVVEGHLRGRCPIFDNSKHGMLRLKTRQQF